MTGGKNKADSEVHPARTRRDRGATFVELLVAIVLLGTVGLAVLAAMRVSVIGTRLERDHSRAFQWLQSADSVLQAEERVGCESGEENVRLSYQDVIRVEVVNPPGWENEQITVVQPVKVWDGANYLDPYIEGPGPYDGSLCFDDAGRLLQLITLQVSSPDGDIIETMQVVKRD